MEAVIISKERFNTMLASLDEIKAQLKNEKKTSEVYIDNQEFIHMMKISKRTAQAWRDEGKVSFSQVGHKIYYKLSDVEELFQKYYVKSFNRKGGSNG